MFRVRGWQRPGSCGRVWGIAMMILGLVLMMIIVPCWAWAGVLCAALIAAGFLIWRGT